VILGKSECQLCGTEFNICYDRFGLGSRHPLIDDSNPSYSVVFDFPLWAKAHALVTLIRLSEHGRPQLEAIGEPLSAPLP
jgi:hypothetical protein